MTRDFLGLKKGDLFLTANREDFSKEYRDKFLVVEEIEVDMIHAAGYEWTKEDINIKGTLEIINDAYADITIKKQDLEKVLELLKLNKIKIKEVN